MVTDIGQQHNAMDCDLSVHQGRQTPPVSRLHCHCQLWDCITEALSGVEFRLDWFDVAPPSPVLSEHPFGERTHVFH